MKKINFEEKVSKDWGWLKLKSKAKKFLNMKKKYIKRYRKKLSEEAITELRDTFEQLKNLTKSKEENRKETLRKQFILAYKTLYKYLPDTVERPTQEFFETLVSAVIIVFFLRAFLVDTYHIPTGSMIPTIMPGDRIFASKFIWGFSIPWKNIKFVQWNDPKKGDIIIFEPPQNKDPKFVTVSGIIDNFVKRMLANEGDTYEIKDNVVYINGKPIERKLLKTKFHFDDRDHQNKERKSVGSLYQETLGTHTYTTTTTNEPLDYFGANKEGEKSVKPLKITQAFKVPKEHYFLLNDYRDIYFFDSRFFGTIHQSKLQEENPQIGQLTRQYTVDSAVNQPTTLPELRIVAKGGDTVNIINKELFINGKKIQREATEAYEKIITPNTLAQLKPYTETLNGISYKVYWNIPATANFGVDEDGKTSFYRIDIPEAGIKKIIGPYTVPKGYCFATGDNRDGSADSRFWGPVPLNNIKGTPMIIWLSTQNFIPRFSRFFNIFYGK